MLTLLTNDALFLNGEFLNDIIMESIPLLHVFWQFVIMYEVSGERVRGHQVSGAGHVRL